MRYLLIVCGVAAALWSGYWFVGSTGVEGALRGWLDARAAQGWVAEYDDVQTVGFPNRFDTTITGLELADPGTGIAWSAPFFQLFTLSYKPNHIIATWPYTQTIASPFQRITVDSERIQASAIFKPDTSLELDHSNFVLKKVALTSNVGWSAEIAEGLFATRQVDGQPNAHNLGLDARDVRPSDGLLAGIDPTGQLPRTFQHLKIDAILGFDAAWDRDAIETRRPAVTDIDLKLLQANWGNLDLWAAGNVTVDAEGRLTGSITVKARNWREMLAIGVSAGWVPQSLAPTLESGLGFLATLAGDPKTLDAPLSFSNGSMSIGPIPLGPAPRIRMR